MKNIIIFIITSIGLVNISFADNQKKLITINQFVNHVALDAAEKGLQDAFFNRKILPSKAEIILSNAQGNITNSVQISKYHASIKPHFMIAIATPAAQTNLRAKKAGTIVAFVAVTDPVAAKLTDQEEIIGVSDMPPVEELINLAIEIFPAMRNVGVIYNSGEVNSLKTMEKLEQILKNKNIGIKKVSIINSNDIKLAIQKLVGLVDLIYLPQDNTVVSALENIISISKGVKIPLISNDPTLVEQGIFIAYGTNYYKSGIHLGNMIADLIEGVEVQPLIQEIKSKELKINYDIAQELDIEVPESIKERETE